MENHGAQHRPHHIYFNRSSFTAFCSVKMYFQVPSPCRREVDRDNKIKNALEELTTHSTLNKSVYVHLYRQVYKSMSIEVR